MGGGEHGGGRGAKETSRWEWVSAAAGALLVAGAIGFLVHEAVVRSPEPPAITFEIDSVAAAPNGFLVQFRARNHGWTTAAGLQVAGELRAGGRSVETSEATLQYLPARAERAAGLFFTEDPRAHELTLRAVGYQTP
jgi:uncharacterized protein (TIGR02588 family)